MPKEFNYSIELINININIMCWCYHTLCHNKSSNSRLRLWTRRTSPRRQRPHLNCLIRTGMDISQERSLQRYSSIHIHILIKYTDHGTEIFVKLLLIQVSKKLTPEQIEAVFSKFDSNGDGRLSMEEFRLMMSRSAK